MLVDLERQSIIPDEIIVIDSSSDDKTAEYVKKHPRARLIVIERADFDHGGTRDYALRESIGDFVLFLTQDALPKDSHYIEHIIRPFDDKQVALVYGRQLPRDDARAAERIIRHYLYPDESFSVTSDDILKMGIKAFHASDVCSAYRRSAYESVGGFEKPVLTNEDMFIAAKFLRGGWTIVYEAGAEVIHSHNFTFKQQYRRNYIQGVEIEKHRNILGSAPLSGEGFALMNYTLHRLIQDRYLIEVPRFIIDCGFRFIGNRKGIIDAKYEIRMSQRKGRSNN